MGVVIFLHGSGDTGKGILTWLEHFNFVQQHKTHKFILPTAEKKPYSLWGGEKGHVWFNRKTLAIDGEEDTVSTQEAIKSIDLLVDELLTSSEIQHPLHLKDIAIGGFSQGGCLALQVALLGKHAGKYAGVFAFSSFLYDSTQIHETTVDKSLPILMTHGVDDSLIPLSSGLRTLQRLCAEGFSKLEFHQMPNLDHEFDQECLHLLGGFLVRVFSSSSRNEC